MIFLHLKNRGAKRSCFRCLSVLHSYHTRFCTQQTKPPTKIVVVGGVAGGASAVARLRRNCDKCNIIMLERGKYVSFANCGLPYYVGNVISDEKKLLAATPSMFVNRFNIDVRNESNVTKIDRSQKCVHIETSDSKVYSESYDKLILAMGASPIRPATIKGINLPGVFSVRSIENSREIREFMAQIVAAQPNSKSKPKCVIVGGGFVGLEMVENMVKRGFECSIVDALPHVMGIMDEEMVLPFHKELQKHGVHLVMNEKLKEIRDVTEDTNSDSNLCVDLESGLSIPTDIIILGLGVLPENKLATDAGLMTGVRGSIVVNDRMQTTDPDIFAVGDVVETYNCITGAPTNLALAGPAQIQARVAADVISRDVLLPETKKEKKINKFRGVQYSSVCGVFDAVLAGTGMTEKALVAFAPELARHARSVYAHPGHHADFYPNAQQMSIKLLFDGRDGRVLGAQCVGTEGVVKSIDTISAFIQMEATVSDLAQAQLCYAPAHGSARGPVNIMGQLAMNVCGGLVDVYHWRDGVQDGDVFLDVRNPPEIENSALVLKDNEKGAKVVNIPLDELRQRVGELEELKKDGICVHTVCEVGKRGYVAARFLSQNGFNTKLCSGGMSTYRLVNGL